MAVHLWPGLLASAQTPAEQNAALRSIKNGIIGHALKKEAVVTSGLLESVVRLARNRSAGQHAGKRDALHSTSGLEAGESVRLQALQLLASIAQEGTQFLAPLQACDTLPAVLSNICPSSNPAPVVLTALRVLVTICGSCALARPEALHEQVGLDQIGEALFSRQHVGALSRILSQCSSFTTVQTQIVLAASLVTKLCREEWHQQALSDSGVLDALATRLASYVVAAQLVIPGAEVHARQEGLFDFIPPPAPQMCHLAVILEAITVIIQGSRYRASQLLYSPSILAIFPTFEGTEHDEDVSYGGAWRSFLDAGSAERKNHLSAMDLLLPHLPFAQMRLSPSSNSAFPPLGSQRSRSGNRHEFEGYSSRHKAKKLPTPEPSKREIHGQESDEVCEEDPESPLIPYLLLLLRSTTSVERLQAAHILVILYRAQLTSRRRESAMSLLVVPLLVTMLDEATKAVEPGFVPSMTSVVSWTLREKAPEVLALLIKDNEVLQKAAYDCGLADKLCKLIKVAYNPVLETTPVIWSPVAERFSGQPSSPSSILGPYGLPPLLAHKIKVRASTLKAMGALVVLKEEYRKAIVEQGMIPFIIESMYHHPKKPAPKPMDNAENTEQRPSGGSEGYGYNTVPVLIAACFAIRALSRSVSVLRTTLIDHGVATPVFELMRHTDVRVQVAASAAVCNLVTDVSPVREAHSSNVDLRLNALWALKHYVCGVPNDVKRQCLDGLGDAWLMSILSQDVEDVSRKDHEGLVPDQDASEDDMDMDHFEDAVDSLPRLDRSRPSSSRGKCLQAAEAKLAILREAEQDAALRARADRIAVQEQILELLRNLITGASVSGVSESTEMIDFLFTTFGQYRLFEVLSSKLRTKYVADYRPTTSTPGNHADTANVQPDHPPPAPKMRSVEPARELIVAVVYILVHMAASVPRHREQVIAQTGLLKLLVPCYLHASVDVRIALCYLVTNLTWVDDAGDGPACVARTAELVRLGFLAKVELLEDADPELNVRQRAKCAVWQMKQPG